MKSAFKVTYRGGGAFDIKADFLAAEHEIKTEATFREVGAGY